MYLFRKGSARVVALSAPKWCDQVLRAGPETFTRDSGIAPVFSEMGGDGVFSAEGDAWRPQRRLAMLALAQRHLPPRIPWNKGKLIGPKRLVDPDKAPSGGANARPCDV